MSAAPPPITGRGGIVVEWVKIPDDDTGLRVTSRGITVAYNGYGLRALGTPEQLRDFARLATKAAAQADNPELAAMAERALDQWRRVEVVEAARVARNKGRAISEFEVKDP